jgi:hypothetical protein
MRWVGHVAGKGDERYEYKILVGKREGKRSLQGQSRGKGDIEIDLKAKSGYAILLEHVVGTCEYV